MSRGARGGPPDGKASANSYGSCPRCQGACGRKARGGLGDLDPRPAAQRLRRSHPDARRTWALASFLAAYRRYGTAGRPTVNFKNPWALRVVLSLPSMLMTLRFRVGFERYCPFFLIARA